MDRTNKNKNTSGGGANPNSLELDVPLDQEVEDSGCESQSSTSSIFKGEILITYWED